MKLSGSQLFAIILCTSTMDYVGLAPALKAGQDAWIVLGIAGVISCIITAWISRASLVFADTGFVRGTQELLGKPVGKLVVLLYLLSWFLIVVIDLRDWTDWVYLILLRYTPVGVTLGLMVALVLYLILNGGITTIGRFGEVIWLIFLLTMVIPSTMMPGEIHGNELLPVYVDSGWRKILQGVILCVSIFSQPATSLWILTPLLANPKRARFAPTLAVGMMSLWTVLAAIVSIMFVGANLAPRCTNAWITYIKSISILDFIQSIDAFSAFVWTFSNTIAISTFLFATSYGLAEWGHTKRWKGVALILGMAAFVCTLLSLRFPHFTTIVRENILQDWVLPVNVIGIPLLLWLAGKWRKHSASSDPALHN